MRRNTNLPPDELLPSDAAKIAEQYRDHRRKANDAKARASELSSRDAVRKARRDDLEAEGRAAVEGGSPPGPVYEDERVQAATDAAAERDRHQAAADQLLDQLAGMLSEVAADQRPHAAARFHKAADDFAEALETLRQARAAMLSSAYEVSWWHRLADGETDVAYDARARHGDELPQLNIGRQRVAVKLFDALTSGMRSEVDVIAGAVDEVVPSDAEDAA